MTRALTRWLPLVALTTFMWGCTTSHQPIEIAPFYRLSAESHPSETTWQEIRALEQNPAKTASQKKRLVDLYRLEGQLLSPDSARFKEVETKSLELGPIPSADVEPVEGSNITEATQAAPILKTGFANAAIRKKFQSAQKLWNQDDTTKALQQITALARDEKIKEGASEEDLQKIYGLWFRIAFDGADLATSEEAFSQLEKLSCSNELAQSAFFLALYAHTQNDNAKALKLLEHSCVPDQSLGNRMRKAYWRYRFATGEESQKAFAELLALPLPGYYAYLALSREGKNLSLSAQTPNPTPEAFSVPGRVNALMQSAENFLREGLRQEAVTPLKKAAAILWDDVEGNRQALLYATRLFQAAGQHLEAMKTLSRVLSLADGPNGTLPSDVEAEFYRLFPRPYHEQVMWLSGTWGVEPEYVYAIMRQESAFDPSATSRSNAKGLMQLMPFLGKYLNELWGGLTPATSNYLYNGRENLRLGIYHLHQLKSLLGHPALVAGAYNAGITRVQRWVERNGHLPLDVFVEWVPIGETRNYIKLVLRNYLYYKALGGNGTIAPGVFSDKVTDSLSPKPSKKGVGGNSQSNQEKS